MWSANRVILGVSLKIRVRSPARLQGFVSGGLRLVREVGLRQSEPIASELISFVSHVCMRFRSDGAPLRLCRVKCLQRFSDCRETVVLSKAMIWRKCNPLICCGCRRGTGAVLRNWELRWLVWISGSARRSIAVFCAKIKCDGRQGISRRVPSQE